MDRLSALQAYVRIVELGSFTAASRDLRLRQATVSRWIANLEDELDVQLLDRTTRAVRVTESGKQFYEQAKRLVDAWHAAVAEVRGSDGEVTGRVRVSLPVVFGQRYVAPRISELLDAHSALELELVYADRYVDLVRDGVDIALRVGHAVDSEYRARIITSTPRRLVAARSYLEREGTPEHPSELVNHTCLLHTGLQNRVVWTFSGADDDAYRVHVRGRFSANHSETLLAMAIAGQGIALLASWLADKAIESGKLISLLPGFSAPPAPIHALYASDKHVPKAVSAVLDFLTEVVRESVR